MRVVCGFAKQFGWLRTAVCSLQAAVLFVSALAFTMPEAFAQKMSVAPEPVFIDTDIGDDIDDAYAVAFALSSPRLNVVGVSSAWGDTVLRARMLSRLLAAAGKASIPLGAGVPTSAKSDFTQREWASEGADPKTKYPDGVELLRKAILRYPGKLTLLAIGPETNLAELLRRDPATFRKLKRIVIMGGSVYVGYKPGSGPEPEWNIVCDAPAAAAVFASGVPLTMMPLDSTVVSLSPAQRDRIYRGRSPLANTLQVLTEQWAAQSKYGFTLYDVVPVAYLLNPNVCPVTPMNLRVDNQGYTLIGEGKPNTQVCTRLDEGLFRSLLFRFLKAGSR